MARRQRLCTVFLFVPLLAACKVGGAPDDGIGQPVSLVEQPLAMRAPGWLGFQDLNLYTDAESKPPIEPFVRGWILGGLFVPDGDVVGVMEAPPRGRRLIAGWLELRTRAFISEVSTRALRPPLVRGYLDEESGSFFPVSGLIAEPIPAAGSP